MEAKELSYVIVPSDIYTHNIRSYSVKPNKKVGLNESLNLKEGEFKKMEDNKTNLEVQENQNISEDVKTDQPADKTATEADTKAQVEKSIVEQKDEEIATLKADIARLEAEKEVTVKDLAKAKTDLTTIVDKLDSVQTALRQEIVLKEAIETKLISSKTELREAVEENLNTLRAALNKPVVLQESLSTRTIESIKDSIVDLKEELTGKNSVLNITESVDETLKAKENIKNTDIDVKEAKTSSNIDMTESTQQTVQDLLKSMLL